MGIDYPLSTLGTAQEGEKRPRPAGGILVDSRGVEICVVSADGSVAPLRVGWERLPLDLRLTGGDIQSRVLTILGDVMPGPVNLEQFDHPVSAED